MVVAHSKQRAGSSPWARGTRDVPGRGTNGWRFIPVGTGNTHNRQFLPPAQAVHPRGHGEHSRPALAPFNAAGSSPWARGTPTKPKLLSRLNRFIPVGTGNTSKTAALFGFNSVHPRGHGEHTQVRNQHAHPRGSSPWARGTHSASSVFMRPPRFIPVGTGNTPVTKKKLSRHAVHPRGHGEHISGLRRHERLSGSSPWARGTPRSRRSRKRTRRFIPVGTGNTGRLH